jgi:hypothetical protein
MRRTHQTSVGTAAVALAVAALALNACSPPSPQENVSQACAAAESLAASVEQFRSTLSADATIEQVRSARDDVVASYDALVAEAQDVAQDRKDELETNVEEFQSAVDDVPDDTKLPDAVESLRNESADVGTALDGLEAELQC